LFGEVKTRSSAWRGLGRLANSESFCSLNPSAHRLWIGQLKAGVRAATQPGLDLGAGDLAALAGEVQRINARLADAEERIAWGEEGGTGRGNGQIAPWWCGRSGKPPAIGAKDRLPR